MLPGVTLTAYLSSAPSRPKYSLQIGREVGGTTSRLLGVTAGEAGPHPPGFQTAALGPLDLEEQAKSQRLSPVEATDPPVTSGPEVTDVGGQIEEAVTSIIRTW